jgi:Protease subunit of ATP-dependent Clp proteases
MVVINITGDIVSNDYGMMYDWFGYDYSSPSKVNKALSSSENTDEDIVVNIASNGGDVFAASEIYSLLKMNSKSVTVNVLGLAASAASVVAMAGNTVNISPTGQIMIHKVWTQSVGNSDDLNHEAQVLDGIDQSIVNAYELKTGMNQADILQLMSNETWLTAQNAVDKGFADSIMFVDQNKPVFTNSLSNLPSADKLNEFMNFMNFKKRNSTPKQKLNQNRNEADLRSSKLAILLQK